MPPAPPTPPPGTSPSSSRALPASLFKAYDIRGIYGQTLTEDAVYRIARALGKRVQQAGRDSIVIGRDGRLSSPALSEALAAGLSDSFAGGNAKVVDIGTVPTPLVYFTAHRLSAGGSAMLTGSHNPPDHNGLKIVIAGQPLYGEAMQSLREEAEGQPSRQARGAPKTTPANLTHHEMIAPYSLHLSSDIQLPPLPRALRIVVDCGNGVAGGVAPQMYRALGMEVSELYCEVDGRFPNHHPDPGRPENLQDLQRTVIAERADLGLAFDGDGDRLGVVGPDGAILWPDRQMMLFARDVLQQRPGTRIIYDVKCSQALTQTIEEAGGIAEMWKTGHSPIKARLKETAAPLAGEFSGHFFFADRWHGADDAIYAGARLCEIVAKAAAVAAGEGTAPTVAGDGVAAAPTKAAKAVPTEPTSDPITVAISALFAALPDTVSTPSLELPLAEGEPHTLARKLVAAADFPDARITTIDGLRVDFADGFALARASNTMPVLILRFEGRDAAALAAIQQRFKAFMLRVEPRLQLPF